MRDLFIQAGEKKHERRLLLPVRANFRTTQREKHKLEAMFHQYVCNYFIGKRIASPKDYNTDICFISESVGYGIKINISIVGNTLFNLLNNNFITTTKLQEHFAQVLCFLKTIVKADKEISELEKYFTEDEQLYLQKSIIKRLSSDILKLPANQH